MVAHGSHFPEACFDPINAYIARTPVASLMKSVMQVELNGFCLDIEYDPIDVMSLGVKGQKTGFLCLWLITQTVMYIFQ